MARSAGPLGNAPRDLRDDFVGEPAEEIKAGKPPRWPTGPKRVKSNTFHSKVTGATSIKRADRASHYRRGGWVTRKIGGPADEATEKVDHDDARSPGVDGKVDNFKRGGHLSAKQRQSLPSSDFALPGKGKGPKGAGSGSYPIPDESHARNALARVSQHGSSEQKAQVRAKVKAKYPGIEQKG